MFILTKEILENNEQIANIIGSEKKLVLSTIESQKALKDMLLNYMQKLADSADNVASNCSDFVLNILQDAKNILKLFTLNSELLNHLLELLDNILLECSKNKRLTSETINNFNSTFFEKSKTVSENTIKIENFLCSISQFSKLTFSNDNYTSIINTVFANNSEESKESIQAINSTDIVENTLIISEAKGKIFLPYTLSSINNILENNLNKYSSLEDLIEKEYTLPFDSFKFPAIARFREAFNLIRKKEKKSIREAFDLGIELIFNYNLHPAIITACKNLDELDAYLEYLENNETNKFNCFKIIFDVAPLVTKADGKYQV